MNKRGVWKLIVVLFILGIVIVAIAIASWKYDLFKFSEDKKTDNKSSEDADFKESPEFNPNLNTSNLSSPGKNEPSNKSKILGGGGGGGGGDGSSDSTPPSEPDKCLGIICNDGYVCNSGLCTVTRSICLAAQENELCEGLNLAYEEGYKEGCHSRYSLC